MSARPEVDCRQYHAPPNGKSCGLQPGNDLDIIFEISVRKKTDVSIKKNVSDRNNHLYFLYVGLPKE
jgi:hypothetical protein